MVNEQFPAIPNRVTIPQLEFLAQCMEKFPSLALATFGKSREETSCAHKKWLQIGSAINKIKPGVTKSGLGWLRYWTNYKYQLRKRYPQFKWSWVSDSPVRVTPLEHRFLQVLADHEKTQPPHVMFQGDQNTENDPTTDDEEKGIVTSNNARETSSMPTKQDTLQPMPTKQEALHAMPTKQEALHAMPTKQEALHAMPNKQEISKSMLMKEVLQVTPTIQDMSSMPAMRVIEVSGECSVESPDMQDDEGSIEDPIGTEKEIKEELQVEILKFNLKRQKEMHYLEMTQMKERHKLEMEILELKKRKLMKDCDRLRNTVYK